MLSYEAFLEMMKPRYGFLNLRKRKYDDPILISKLRTASFTNFTKEQTIDVLKTLNEKNAELLRVINIHTMTFVMNGEINLRDYSFTDEEITKIFIPYVQDYNAIPEYVKINNEEIVNYFLEKGQAFELRNEFIKYCPSLTNKINDMAYKLVFKNYSSYENRLGDFKDVFIGILRNNQADLKSFLDILLNNNCNLEGYYDLYRWNESFKQKYFLSNFDKINKDNYMDIPSEILEDVLNKYLDTNYDSEIADYMFSQILNPKEETCAKVIKLYSEKKLNLSKNSIKKLINYYPDVLLDVDFNNLTTIVEYYRNQNQEYITISNFQSFMKIMIEHKAKLDIVFARAFISEMLSRDIEEMSSILENALNSNILDNDFLNTIIKDMSNYNIRYIKIIYDYFQKNNIDFDKDKFLRKINSDNYNLELLDTNEDIYLNVYDFNKDQIFAMLKQLKDRGYQNNVNLIMDIVERDFILKANELLPNQIKIGVKRHQDFSKNPMVFYSVDEILEKDRILQQNADSVKSIKSKSGQEKILSPFEKFISAYLMTTRFLKYTEEDETENPHENYYVSRSVYEFINSKNPRIVCVGYSNLLVEYLDRMGLKGTAETLSLHNKDSADGHAVVVIHIDDPKYGLKGTYISDPTDDAVKYEDIPNPPDNNIDYQDTHSNSVDGMLIPIEKYLQEKPFYEIGKPDLKLPLIEEKDKYAKSEVDKKQIVYGLLAVRHFLNKNDEMVSENVIGENGYTEKEFNDMASSYVFLHSEIINEEKYINSFFTMPVSKMIDEILSLPDKEYVHNQILLELVYKVFELPLEYISLPYEYDKVTITLGENIDLNESNINQVRSLLPMCTICENPFPLDACHYSLEYTIDSNKTMLENFNEMKQKHKMVMEILNGYKKQEGTHI